MSQEAPEPGLTGDAPGDDTTPQVHGVDPAWYGLALKAARLGLWRYDLETGLAHLDERMRQIWGEPSDALALPVEGMLQRVHTDDRKRVEAAVRAALGPQSAGDYEIEYRIIWPDGS